MTITLNLSSSELDSEDLQALTRQLCNSIVDETSLQAEIPSGAVQQGHRGDIVTIGTIALAFLTGGGAVALGEVFKAYFSRVPSLNIELERADGSKVKISGQHLKPEQLQALLSQANNSAH